MPKWIDAHTHLHMLESEDEALSLANTNHVDHMINVGTHVKDHALVLSSVKKHFPRVAGILGIHPHDSKEFTQEVEHQMRADLLTPGIIGLGETGLDYYYDHSPREVQRDVFAKQLQIAMDLDLPVEIHSRDAEQDTISALRNCGGKIKGLIHCFTGSQTFADEALNLGFLISISGVVTFKNSNALQDVVKHIPLNRLVVETDAPFLAPVPFRGKKNTPAFVVHTAEKVAQLKGISLEDLCRSTYANIRELFQKWQLPS